MAFRLARRMLRSVDQQHVSEFMPVLYRSVLDAVAFLESVGLRRDAALIRSDATAAYSGAWDHRAARRLQVLRAKADRVASSSRRTRRTISLDTLERRPDLERTTV